LEKENEMKTLHQFVKISGSQEKAAIKIRVSIFTINRWLKGKNKPKSGIVLDKLKELGIKV